MPKVKMLIEYDYITGHLRYGHREGTFNVTKEELEALRKDSIKAVRDLDLECEMELEIDDYDIDDTGIGSVIFSVIDEEDD